MVARCRASAAAIAAAVLVSTAGAATLWPHAHAVRPARGLRAACTPTMLAAKGAKKKRGGGGAAKGFGGGAAPAPAKKGAASATPPPAAAVGSDDASAAWLRLRAWLEERGAALDGVDVGIVDPSIGLRGVRAARAFARGEEIIKIPRDECILDEAHADASPVGAVYADSVGTDAVPACVRTALLLLFRAAAPTEAEEWRPVLEMLPSAEEFAEEGGPMELWADDELAACECPQLIAEVRARRASLRALYESTVRPGWEAAAAPGGPLAGLGVPSLEQLQWAVATVTSRAYGEGEPGSGRSSMLIPAADLCNHHQPDRVNTVKALAPWGAFVVLAARPIEPGEEVLVTYGPMPARKLVQQFGFMLPPEPALDRALARLPLAFGVGGASAGADGGAPIGFGDEGAGAADAGAVGEAWWTDALTPAARAALDELVAARELAADARGRVRAWQLCGAALERALGALRALGEAAGGARLSYAELVRAELGEYSTTVEADLERLGAAGPGAQPLPPRTRLALDFRTRAKQLLLEELSRAQHAETQAAAD